LKKYDKVFIVMFIVCVALRGVWLDQPSTLIFDEYYYVNTARNVLHFQMPQDNPYADVPAGIDGNDEHPGLFKGFMELSMLAFGNNGIGWRFPSVVLGSLSILFFYLLMKRLTDKEVLPIFAAYLFSFENLFFIHSRIAILDIGVLSFGLLAYYAYFSNKMWLTGVALGLATACKITGIFAVGTIIFYHIFMRIGYEKFRDVKQNTKTLGLILGLFIAVLLGIVTLTDYYTSVHTNPIEHLKFIWLWGQRLTAEQLTGIESAPWEWAINVKPITYLHINVQYIVDDVVRGEATKYLFIGTMNPALAYLFLPSVGYSLYLLRKKENKTLILFALSIIVMQYLPYFPMRILWYRITYLYYILPTVPAIAMLVSEGVTEQKYAGYIIIALIYACIAGFAIFFPFRMIP